ncbi:MAG: hypothetical protein E6K70_24080 [Planctomycetota bacterium]|nr:MAG: hypothetical protein E6K70_24080 [Planctomycetota bacterium]
MTVDLPEPPRRLRRRPGRGCGPLVGLWFVRLFILPHTLIGIALAGAAAFGLFVWLFGADIPGRITSLDVARGRKGGNRYQVDYAYSVAGIQYPGTTYVSANVYAGLRVGDAYPVRVFRPLPTWMPQPRGPGSSASMVFALPFFALFWNGILSVFLWMAWVAPWRVWLLMRYGLATAGVVAGKHTRPGNKGSTNRLIRYRFKVTLEEEGTGAALPETFEREMSVMPSDYAAAKMDQPVTVIYHPKNPKRSLVYEFSEYEALPQG